MKNLIVEFVREVLAERSGKRSKKKPGGPRTDMGAIRQLNPGEFSVRVKGAVDSAGGDVEKAAKNLDVATRTLYHYLDTEPGLGNVETSSEREDAEEKGKLRPGQKKGEE
jgi:hypothetical protein